MKGREGAPIYGGTQLPHSYDLLEHPIPLMLKRINRRLVNPCFFKDARIVRDLGGNNYHILFDDTIVEPTVEEEP